MPKVDFAKIRREPIQQRQLIYSNPLAQKSDVIAFVLEGGAKISFIDNCMKMENLFDPGLGQTANFVFWCDKDFPGNISIEWKFKPIEEPGLAIIFFCAKGLNEESIFDPSLQKRDGVYKKYHSGDINTYHISYFRRKQEEERTFHICNLRKSRGFKLCTVGADPIPSVPDVKDFYNMRIDKIRNSISFSINELTIFNYLDDESDFLTNGKIGFRQMAPLKAQYKELNVYEIL